MFRSIALSLFFLLLIAALVYWHYGSPRRHDSLSSDSREVYETAPQTMHDVAEAPPAATTAAPPVVTTPPPSALTLPETFAEEENDEEGIAGELILRRAHAATLRAIERLCEQHGIQIESRVDELGLLRVKLPPGMSLPEAEELLRDMPEIDDVYRNVRARVPRDIEVLPPLFEGREITPVTTRGLDLIHSRDPSARQSHGNNIIVAVLDTGVDATHPDLVSRTLRGYNFIDDSPVTSDPHAHGTACAGIIAGTGVGEDTARGVAPGAWILPVTVMDAQGNGTAYTVVEGIVYAVRRGAKVIAMSLGTHGDSIFLRDAVDYAHQNGTIIVASIGNEGEDTTLLPAGYAGVISVGAVDAQGQRAPFSNFNNTLDIVAPGVAVHTTAPDGGYMLFSGTSAAVPFVAGAVAALRSSFPQYDADAIIARLLDNTDDRGFAGHDPYYGRGSLNLRRALRRPQERINDMAVTDLFPIPMPPMPGELLTIHCVVQNQGTREVHGAELFLRINETREEIRLPRLASGESYGISREVLLPDTTATVVRVEAYCRTREPDAYPDNNGRAFVLTTAEAP